MNQERQTAAGLRGLGDSFTQQVAMSREPGPPFYPATHHKEPHVPLPAIVRDTGQATGQGRPQMMPSRTLPRTLETGPQPDLPVLTFVSLGSFSPSLHIRWKTNTNNNPGFFSLPPPPCSPSPAVPIMEGAASAPNANRYPKLPAWAGPEGQGAVGQACPSTEGGARSTESI